MNVQERLIPIKRGDLVRLSELKVNDEFHYQGKPNDAYQVTDIKIDRWGEIAGVIVAPRVNKNKEVIKPCPNIVVVVYLRTITQD